MRTYDALNAVSASLSLSLLLNSSSNFSGTLITKSKRKQSISVIKKARPVFIYSSAKEKKIEF